MFEIKKDETSKHNHLLLFNGQIIDDVIVRKHENFCSIATKHGGASKYLSAYKFNDFNFANYITLCEYYEIDNFYFDVIVVFTKNEEERIAKLNLRFTPDLHN
jgi:hypothetical protein